MLAISFLFLPQSEIGIFHHQKVFKIFNISSYGFRGLFGSAWQDMLFSLRGELSKV